MEGAYHKILQSRSSIPSPQFQVFLDMLVSTVRDAIAVCFPPRSTAYLVLTRPSGMLRGSLR